MTGMDPEYVFAIILVAALLLVYRRSTVTPALSFPPGPRPDPWIGNLRHIPKTSPWLTYTEWKKTYGDIISVGALGKRIVVVNSAKAASDIFEKRGRIYSDRPHNVMIQDLMGIDNTAFLQYTDTLRTQRKLLNAALNPTAVVDYVHIQEKETYALLNRLLESPERYSSHLRRMAASVVTTIGYGHVVTTDDDSYVATAEAIVKNIRRSLQPTSFLVNLSPALKYTPSWFPLASFHRFGQEGRELYQNFRNVPFDRVKSQMAEGIAPHSYTSKLLEAKGSITGQDDEEDQIKTTASALYGAGSETTMTSILTFILAMIMHPDVQKKAQAEIDAVIGSSRLPTVEDKGSLPYLNCVLSEVMRWRPVSALGVPHAAHKDDVYDGHFISKGAIIISNIWAITHDEDLYEDPERFWPERFDGRFPNIKDPRAFVFGFGRRLCPGRHLAINSVFIAMACLLSTFSFSKARDADGNEMDPLVDYSLGTPKPFECRITPRNSEAVSLIKATQTASEL